MRNLLALLLIVATAACVPQAALNEDAEHEGELQQRHEQLVAMRVQIFSRTNCEDAIAQGGLSFRVRFSNGNVSTYATDGAGVGSFLAEPRSIVRVTIPGYEDAQIMNEDFPSGAGCFYPVTEIYVGDSGESQSQKLYIIEEDAAHKNSTFLGCHPDYEGYISTAACG